MWKFFGMIGIFVCILIALSRFGVMQPSDLPEAVQTVNGVIEWGAGWKSENPLDKQKQQQESHQQEACEATNSCDLEDGNK